MDKIDTHHHILPLGYVQGKSSPSLSLEGQADNDLL